MKKPKPRGRNDGHKLDYSKITENIFIGSNLCKGSICPVHSDKFEKLGICVELNLSSEKKEIPPDNIDLYVWIPVIDGYPPSPDQFDLGTSIIHQAVLNNKKAYVHCKNGHGRSPTMVAAYFIRFEYETIDNAQKIIKEKREEVHFEETQIKGLKQFHKRWFK